MCQSASMTDDRIEDHLKRARLAQIRATRARIEARLAAARAADLRLRADYQLERHLARKIDSVDARLPAVDPQALLPQRSVRAL